ncbi:MAG: hypothetical protein VX438_18210 [Planctomycetota bacterium]|nr:hypothetical protein [Planctomycetota bacterium]
MRFYYLLLLTLIGFGSCAPTPTDQETQSPKSEVQPDSKGKSSQVDLENPGLRSEGDSPQSSEFQITHLVVADAEYYLDGPQQMRAPDGRFSTGTKVQLLQDSGSYSVVVSEDGIRAHVSTASLGPAKRP